MDTKSSHVLNEQNRNEIEKLLSELVALGIDFKLQDKVHKKNLAGDPALLMQQELPSNSVDMVDLIDTFKRDVLPHCTNFSSKHFMGFPDAGNSIASLAGGLLQEFLQQNLINQSFCSPSGTFVEIAVIRWLREVVGYETEAVSNIWDVGGVITPGGTVSNAIGMMLARENKQPGALENGVTDPSRFKVVVPKGIGHYSVKSAQMWIGCGTNLVEVDTIDFRYDLDKLRTALVENKGSIMAVVAYAGDSRTMTVDNFDAVADLVHEVDPSIWLHADACHGFSLGFSKSLKHKIAGIEKFDSISADPHKVMLSPYTVSALLVRDPKKMQTITSKSDLIMQEQFAFGQITPFLGSKPWLSLKLWFMMQHFGKSGLDDLITSRHTYATLLAKKLSLNSNFVLLNKVEINSVAFFYTGGRTSLTASEVNTLNKLIHKRMLDEGVFHLHQFSIPDSGVFEKGVLVYPLRFMCGNPNADESDLDQLISYLETIGEQCAHEIAES